jgi:hypothetical protein
MKNQLTALALITATAFTFAPKPAEANDKGLAIVGGFLGGLIVASAINDSHHDSYVNGRTTVVVAGRDDRCDDRGREGFWKEVSVKVWIPGCWIEERSHHGSYRRYVGGHYEYRCDRVWVSYDRYDRHDRDYRGDYRR